jgi:segregation and condensation protein A
MEIVVTFMVVLEMMKVGKFLVKQDNLFDDIMITYAFVS